MCFKVAAALGIDYWQVWNDYPIPLVQELYGYAVSDEQRSTLSSFQVHISSKDKDMLSEAIEKASEATYSPLTEDERKEDGQQKVDDFLSMLGGLTDNGDN